MFLYPKNIYTKCVIRQILQIDNTACFLVSILAYFFVTQTVFSQTSKGKVNSRNLSSSFEPLSVSEYNLQAGSTLDRIFTNSTDTQLYDPVTISNLKGLKELAQPEYDSRDIDPYRTRRIVEKALSIQVGQNISRLVNRSDIQGEYRSLQRELRNIQSYFRYSVQTTGEEIALTKKRRGKKLVELNVEFNLKQGVDPQLKLGDSIKFRYDYIEQRPLLEYGFNF